MEPQKKIRFYQKKGFSALLAVALAVILLGNNVLNNMPTLFATDEADVSDGYDIVVIPDAQTTPELQPTNMSDHALEITTEGLEPEGLINPEYEEIPGAWHAPVYIRVSAAKLYSSSSLRSRTLRGTVDGVTLALRYYDGENAAVHAVFNTESGRQEGYFSAQDIEILNYQEIIEEIREIASDWHGSEEWPLPMAGFKPAKVDEPIAQVKPESEAEPEAIAIVEPIPGDPTAEAIAAAGLAYARIDGNVFGSAGLEDGRLYGWVSGIAIVLASNEATDTAPATLRIVFSTEHSQRKCFVDVGSATLLDYEEAIREIGADIASEYDSAAWPLPVAVFVPTAAAEAEPDAASTYPRVVITVNHADEITAGSLVELKAEVFNAPAEQIAGYQWKNNATGTFIAVPGATEATYTFPATEDTNDCDWIVEVLLF